MGRTLGRWGRRCTSPDRCVFFFFSFKEFIKYFKVFFVKKAAEDSTGFFLNEENLNENNIKQRGGGNARRSFCGSIMRRRLCKRALWNGAKLYTGRILGCQTRRCTSPANHGVCKLSFFGDWVDLITVNWSSSCHTT